ASRAAGANGGWVWRWATSPPQPGLVHPPASISPTPPGSCMTSSTDTYSAATIFPTGTSKLGAVPLTRVPASLVCPQASEAVLNKNDGYPPRAEVAIGDGVWPTKRLRDLVTWARAAYPACP